MRVYTPIFALCLLALTLIVHAGPVRKGNWYVVDELLSESFETESWRLTWTVVDADSSGSCWERLSRDDWYEPRAGDWSLGSRFNADGSQSDDWLITPPMRVDSVGNVLKHEFRIDYRSQDPSYLEALEFYVLEVDAPILKDSLHLHLSDFTMVESHDAVPTSWQTFLWDCGTDTTKVWYVALRSRSQDQFVLLVDQAQGMMTLPPGTPVESAAG